VTVNPVEPARRIGLWRWLRFAATVVITVGLLVLVLRAIEPGSLRATLARASLGLLPVALVAAFAFVAARAWRYWLLLGTERVASAAALLPISLGAWGISLLLPGPTGDGTFVWLARTRLGVPITVGAGAAVVARLLDVASLILLALITAPLANVILPGRAWLVGLALALAAALVLAFFFWRRSRRAISDRLPDVPWVGAMLAKIQPAIDELGGGSRPAQLVLATIAARVATAVQYLALFTAIHQPLGFWQVWFALSVRTLLLAIPVQGVGGLGTSQVWWTAALRLLGWPLKLALPVSLAVHLLDLTVSLPLGIAGWAILYLLRRRPSEPGTAQAAAQRA
jgi:lysylphosphatidylglycerol synthase-like protein